MSFCECRYLCYQDYLQMGGTLPVENFDRLEYRAEKIIESRINATIRIDNDLKRCMFELIDFLNAVNVNGVIGSVKSVSNDGYSVSLNTASSGNSNFYDVYGIDGIINTYLSKYLKPRGICYV